MPLTEAVKDGFSRYLPFRPPTLPSSSPLGQHFSGVLHGQGEHVLQRCDICSRFLVPRKYCKLQSFSLDCPEVNVAI